MVIHFNQKRCIGCHFCIQVCPRGCFEFNAEKNKADVINPIFCLKCRACELNCEGNALKIEKFIFHNFLQQLI
ncbi:MAG: ferredoxin family protein [Promethearchaeota archaeon]